MKTVLIVLILLISISLFAMTDSEMETIMKESDNWTEFQAALDTYVENQGIQNWDFHDQVAAYLQDDVGPMSESEAWTWWNDDHDFYSGETQVEWIFPWGLWYMKFLEWYNGTQWM